MEFKNRQVTNPNSKILNITNITYNANTGEISALTVNEQNNEGVVTEEGTKLNAQNLNNAFESLNRNKFLHFYFKEVYGININEESYTLNIVGQTSVIINVSYDDITPLYLSINDVSNPNYNITINNSTNPKKITITRTNNLNVNDSGRIYVNVNKSSVDTTLVCTLNFKYTYTRSSVYPID